MVFSPVKTSWCMISNSEWTIFHQNGPKKCPNGKKSSILGLHFWTIWKLLMVILAKYFPSNLLLLLVRDSPPLIDLVYASLVYRTSYSCEFSYQFQKLPKHLTSNSLLFAWQEKSAPWNVSHTRQTLIVNCDHACMIESL